MANKLMSVYLKHYKKLIIIPSIILVLSIFIIGMKISSDGDFIYKDISLKGGVALTIIAEGIDLSSVEGAVSNEFLPYRVSVRSIKGAGANKGVLIESDIEDLDQDRLEKVLSAISAATGKSITKNDYSLEVMGSSLGNSFFTQMIRAMVVAFIFMGIVVFITFRTFVPSIAVILCAFSDIVVTIAVLDFMKIPIGTGGIAALLMLIGYSIDENIMLTTNLLKRKTPSVEEPLLSSFRTGMTMVLTTLTVSGVALLLSESEIIKEIMLVVFIGLISDILFTWLQNAGLLLWHVTKKNDN
ncbi:protein translocase subunit SecF [Candidatus Woesearchaeota archaeon]|nr:protein translocase subunit SecF [Candidatus Woesearchaeota archaeon]